MTEPRPDVTDLPDLASRRLGGSVVAASDELFAEKENLIKPEAPAFAAGAFGNRGKIYDGWETRRRRGPGHDHAIVRLGVPGIVHGVVVDTSFFRGNYPPQVSVEALGAEGYPSPDELAAMTWHTLVARTDARGDAVNIYPVAGRRTRWTHVRLSIYPDGGVARFRVHGTAVPDPRFLAGTIDLAAAEHGGRVTGCSDAFYSSAGNLILPGRAAGMGEGWENARRRGPGHDYVVVALAAAGELRHVEIDTTWFVGNAPGWVRLLAADSRGAGAPAGAPVDPAPGSPPGAGLPARPEPPGEGSPWREVLPLTRVQPDTRHRFPIAGSPVATHVRLDVIPDGGLARLRVNGEIVPDALDGLRQRWWDALPDPQREEIQRAGG
jgi:allantoicase